MTINFEDEGKKPETRSTMNIPIGTVFCGDPEGYEDNESIYLRTFHGLVDLKDPNHTWNSNVEIVGYRTLRAELTVEYE